jgi:cell division protein FtsL
MRIWERVLLVVLGFAVLGSAFGVVYAKHQSRKLFVQLQQMQKEQDAINENWGRLQLEQSTWSTHARVEQVASKRMGMVLPSREQWVIVKP